MYRLLLLLIVAACASTQIETQPATTPEVPQEACPSPLPASYHISPPAADVPEEIARYLGKWGNARWGNYVAKGMCAALVVIKVFPGGGASVIYSWGSIKKHHPTVNIDTEGGYDAMTGRIADGVLYLTRFRNGAEVKYWFDGDVLKGMYIRKKYAFGVELTKLSE